ncbi:MAG TPA: diguanylate cyclase [Gemmatimonadales bacterium]|nr:diguanylate cyclase [Gemmatimonadales bacterium]
MTIWDKIIRSLRTLRLDTMRGKFVAFAVLATLFTTLAMTVMLYGRNRRSLSDRVGQELRGLSSDVAREADVWLDQRVYDLRLRASPYVVSDNLARATGRTGAQSLTRLRDYLNTVRQNLRAHEGLVIIGRDGQVLTSSGSRTGFRLTPDRMSELRTRDALVGEPFWDASIGKAALVVVVPIRQDDGVFLGALGAKINLDSLRNVLDELSANQSRNLYLITEQGRVVATSAGNSAEAMKTTLPEATTRELIEREGQTVAQSRPQGREVLAVLRRIPQLRWAAVAETPRAEAVREAGVLRFRTVLLMIALLIGVGLLAFIVGSFVTGPLERLSEGAARVAAGDLSVELPPGGSGEVGYLTRAFNTLVSRLREKESQGELEKLSLTDSLTGLYNRRHLMGTLASEVQRSRRLRRAFSVLLADVDRFKQYNDTHGHLAGDAALVKIAEVFRKTTRQVDCVARYGGEEFVVMLLEANLATATLVAERIRARVAEQDVGEGHLTLSIGVAEYPDGGDTPEELIATADGAMYKAKSSGRNQVVVAGTSEPRPLEKEKKTRRKREA